jgi:hypothetical protein
MGVVGTRTMGFSVPATETSAGAVGAEGVGILFVGDEVSVLDSEPFSYGVSMAGGATNN